MVYADKVGIPSTLWGIKDNCLSTACRMASVAELLIKLIVAHHKEYLMLLALGILHFMW